jgi:DNA-binding transcriptional MerR regulator
MYGPDDICRAAEVVTLRALGLSLAQIDRVLNAYPSGLDAALEAHEARLEAEANRLDDRLGKVRALRERIARGEVPATSDRVRLVVPPAGPIVAFDLPWPWGGERFELRSLRKLTYITGPLGSGKTRLAMRLAQSFENAAFLGLDRLSDDGAAARSRLATDPALAQRIEAITAWLIDEGASCSGALTTLLVALEAEGPSMLVIDMMEEGLDESTQEALTAYLRGRHPASRPLIVLTRSSAILDLDAVTAGEAIILCPANHSRPFLVEPVSGSPGYDSVATCLAAPAVRARTQGVIAIRAS